MYTGQPIALSEQQLIDCDRAGELQPTRKAICPCIPSTSPLTVMPLFILILLISAIAVVW